MAEQFLSPAQRRRKIFSLRKTKAKSLGDASEDLALKHLEAQGLKTLARNYRCNQGEIDLIMNDKNTLVFIEVRYRKNANFGSALESITESKQHKIITTARHYLSSKKISDNTPMRFDVVGITSGQVQWVKNAF